MAKLRDIFGQRVRAIRRERGLTQEALARAVGIDYKHLGAIERGLKAPSFDLVDRVAEELGVEHYKLFLPAPAKGKDVETDLRAVLSDMTKVKRVRIQQFFTEVLRVVKRLD